MKLPTLIFLILFASGLIALTVWKTSETAVPESELQGFQKFNRPFEMPAEGKADMRFHLYSPWKANQIPIATTFDIPMGGENGALVYNAQPFWENNQRRGGRHTGDDLNGIGGMNTDLGDPIFAAGDGLVVYTGEPSPGWGKVVILAHETPSGEKVQSMYAHHDEIQVKYGDLIPRGTQIGTNGTANGNYPAHLHFEIRQSDGVDIGSGYTTFPMNRINPTKFIANLHDSGPSGITPPLLKYALESPREPWTELEIQGAEIFAELE